MKETVPRMSFLVENGPLTKNGRKAKNILIHGSKSAQSPLRPFAFEEILRHSKENYEKHIAFFAVVLYNIIV